MAGKLSFSIALNLLTENFKKGTNDVRNAFRSMQAQILTFAAALGFAGVSLSNLLSDLIRVARETSKAVTSLKNVSGSTAQFASNLSFTTQMAKKYGVYVNDLTGNFAKFTAAASIAGMSMDDQRKLFESLSRASGAFALSADETNGVFLAVTQMMGKGKIQAEELRGQLGERLPIAMQAMAKAAGTTVAGLDKIMKEGKLLSADVLPKLGAALNEMLPNVDTDNIETSLNRLKNAFKEFTENTGIQGAYKGLIDGLTSLVNYAKDSVTDLVAFIGSLIGGTLLGKVIKFFNDQYGVLNGSVKKHEVAEAQKQLATGKRIDAEKTYEAIKTQYETKENGKRLANKAQVSKAKKALDAAEFAEKKAMIAATTAAENAAAIKSMGFWKKTGAVILSVGSRISTMLKTVWSTVWPLALVTAIAGVVSSLTQMYSEVKRIRNILPETKKIIESPNNPSTVGEVNKLQQLKGIIDDVTASTTERKKALSQVNDVLGTTFKWNEKTLSVQGDINSAIQERIRLLENAARIDALITQKQKLLDRQTGLENAPVNSLNYQQGFGNYLKGSKVGQYFGFKTDKQLNKEELANTHKAIALLDEQLAGAVRETLTGKSGSIDPGDKKEKKTPLQKEEEKYAEAVTELTNKLNNRAISEENYKNQLEDLNKATYDTLSGMLTPDEAAKNKTYQTVKDGFSTPSPVDGVMRDFQEEMATYTRQLERGILAEDEVNKARLDLVEKILRQIAGMDNIGEAGLTAIKDLSGQADTLRPKVYKRPDIKTRDTTFDYKKSSADIASEDLSIAKENLDRIKEAYNNGNKDLLDELNAAMTDVTTLDKALKIAEVKKDIKDLSKELNEGMYSGIKDIASSSDRLVSAFASLSDVMNDEDATAWERIMAVWNAMINTVDAFMSIVKTIEALSAVIAELSGAKKAENELIGTGAEVAAAIAGEAITSKIALKEIETSKSVTAAKNAEAAAKTNAAYAGIPFVGIMLATAQIAAMEALVVAAGTPKFANGGIIDYGSASGDKTLARVNKGEMILNGHQQATLFQLANGQGIRTVGGGGDVEFKIKYDTLVGVLKTGDRNYRRGR